MTPDQDIERVLDRWLTEGPTQMPSRFLDETFDRIDRAPHHRLAGLQTRLRALRPDIRFGAAAAVVLAAAGLALAALTQTGAVGRPPSAGSRLLPTSGEVVWQPVGTRQHPTISGGTGESDLGIVIDPTTITIYEWHGDIRNSASLVGTDRLDLRLIDNPVVQWGGGPRKVWPCDVGDAGTYSYRLSSGDRHLTLTAVDDACPERATILAGDWIRTDLGDITPGRHVAQVFRPFGGGTSGQFSYSVPTGWAESQEDAGGLSLWMPAVAGVPSIGVFSNVVPLSNSPDAGCAASPADVQRTPAAIAAWLATRVVVTTPTPITIGGLSGVMVDASADPSLVTCPDLFFDFTYQAAAAISGEHRARYFILDRGDGQILLISIDTSAEGTWDGAIANAMPVVQSFEFIR
jgi:hypothetical protein